MNQSAFNRSIWLLNTIYQAGPDGITYEDICKRWQESGLSKGKNYPLRSFHNHRKEIQDIFNVTIVCKKNTNCYYISTIGQVDYFPTKLLGLVSVNQLIHSKEVKQRVAVNMFPGGETFLPVISQAITDNQCLKVEFQPWGATRPIIYEEFQPYALKEYKNVWYLIGAQKVEIEDDKEISAAIPEMLDLRYVNRVLLLKHHFAAPDETMVNSLLVENYGSKVEDIETQEIMIRVSAETAEKLKWNPLHSSQKEIEKRRNYAIMYMYLKPTTDFVRDLLGLGTNVEVLMPQELKDKMVAEAKKIVRKNS